LWLLGKFLLVVTPLSGRMASRRRGGQVATCSHSVVGEEGKSSERRASCRRGGQVVGEEGKSSERRASCRRGGQVATCPYWRAPLAPTGALRLPLLAGALRLPLLLAMLCLALWVCHPHPLGGQRPPNPAFDAFGVWLRAGLDETSCSRHGCEEAITICHLVALKQVCRG